MTKRRVELNSMEGFYRDIYRNALITKQHTDIKANWIIAISAAIIGLSMPHLSAAISDVNFGYLIIFLSAFISFLLGLMIISVPQFIKLVPHDEKDLMYVKRARKLLTVQEYVEKLKQIKTSDDVVEQYVRNLYNMYNRNVAVKAKMLKAQVYILFLGILSGGLLLIFM